MKKGKLMGKICCLLCLSFLTLQQPVYAKTEELQSSDTLYHDLSYEDELKEAVDVLSLGDVSSVTEDLVLPDSYGIHINITWSSSDENVIALSGKVTASEESDTDVTLTAQLSSTKTTEKKDKTFKVHVPKVSVDDILAQDELKVQQYVDYVLNNGYEMPTADEIGTRSQIEWQVKTDNVKISDGKLEKTDGADERQKLELTAELSYKGKNKTVALNNRVLLDEYEAYILSYFAGKNESKEMYIAYSYDGVHWMRLNQADAVLTPKKGNKQIRDPYIMRKKDGSFAVFATNGWTSPMITIWDSDNLTEFENERLCKVSEKGGVASGYYAWAPECNYDPIEDTYTVYWSDPQANDGAGQTYYNTSTDLKEFSKAGVLFEREFFIIDASIKKYKGKYYMVYDDATGDNDTGNGGRRIYVAKANSLKEGEFYPYSGVMSEGVAEGPFLLQNFKDDSWFLYYDYYSKHKFGLTTTDNIEENKWTYAGISDTMPWDEVRHGGGIAVTKKELDRILEKWGLDNPELVEVTKQADIKISKGKKLNTSQFPQNVEVLLSDGSYRQIPVKWNIDNVSTKEVGSVKVTGVFDDNPATFENEEQIAPEVTVIVEKNNLYKILIPFIIIFVVIVSIMCYHFRKR